MELSDKIRRAAFALAVGSMGVGIGYVANDVVEIIWEMRGESAAEKEEHDRYLREREQRCPPPSAHYETSRPELLYMGGPGARAF